MDARDLSEDRGPKRSRSEMEQDENNTHNGKSLRTIFRNSHKSLDSSSDDDFGPTLPTSQPKKKRRRLPYEKLYVAAMPTAVRYSKSLMHREQLFSATFTPVTDFLITSSIDGVVKFWKKTSGGIEFVKEFRAHSGEIQSTSVSADGRSYASAGSDKTVKIFDIITFG
jgi:peptidylprolyl isomerase domain and WD repeat-containing protein 1